MSIHLRNAIQFVQRCNVARAGRFDRLRFVSVGRLSKTAMERLEPRYLFSTGALDPTFGTGGAALFNPIAQNEDFAFHMAMTSDGKIITTDTGDYNHSNFVRVNADGSLDTTFGDNGLASFKFADKMEQVSDIALDSQGRIVFVGSAQNGDFQNVYVGRLNSDGTVDTTFGNGGTVFFNFVDGQRGSEGENLTLTPDGKIIVAGRSFRDAEGDDWALARFNSDGSFDTTFAGTGREELNLPIGNYDYDVMAAPNGKILMTGEFDVPDSTGLEMPTAQAVRLNADGSFDATFGDNGVVKIDVGGVGGAFQSGGFTADGKILLSTYIRLAGDGPMNFGMDSALTELNDDGSLNTAFGGTGIVRLNAATSQESAGISKILVQSNGNILAASGFDLMPLTTGLRTPALLQFNPDGTFDPDFGNGGILQPTLPFAYDAAASDMAVTPDGKVDIVGVAIVGDDGAQILMARYDLDGVSVPSLPPDSGDDQPMAPPTDTPIDVAFPTDEHLLPDPPVTVGGGSAAPVVATTPLSLHAATTTIAPLQSVNLFGLLSDNGDDLLQPSKNDIVADV